MAGDDRARADRLLTEALVTYASDVSTGRVRANTVDKDINIEQRKVEIGSQEGPLRVIASGIGAGDRIVVNGLQRAIPGQKIDPQEQPATASR